MVYSRHDSKLMPNPALRQHLGIESSSPVLGFERMKVDSEDFGDVVKKADAWIGVLSYPSNAP